MTPFFGTGDPGPCPICGAANTSCVGDGGAKPHNVAFIYEPTAGEKDVVRFRSIRQVFENGVQKYGVGTEIPLIEALRQGQVRYKDLTKDDIDQLKQHVDKGLLTVTDLKAFLSPPNDKMLRSENVVTK